MSQGNDMAHFYLCGLAEGSTDDPAELRKLLHQMTSKRVEEGLKPRDDDGEPKGVEAAVVARTAGLRTRLDEAIVAKDAAQRDRDALQGLLDEAKDVLGKLANIFERHQAEEAGRAWEGWREAHMLLFHGGNENAPHVARWDPLEEE